MTSRGENRKQLSCSRCGRPVQVGYETERAVCSRCLCIPPADPPQEGTPSPPRKAGRLRRFIAARCANSNAARGHRECLFLHPDTGYACRPPLGYRCGWLERYVLADSNGIPLEIMAAYPGEALRRKAQTVKVEKAFAFARKRACPDCGTPIEARRRYCQRCAERRRRDSKRRSQRRRRNSVPDVDS